MRITPLIAALSLAACYQGPDPTDDPPALMPSADGGVARIQQALSGINMRVHWQLSWNRDWDTVLEGGNGPVSVVPPAQRYISPVFNMFVSPNLNGSGSIYSGYIAPTSTAVAAESCYVCPTAGRLGGITQQEYTYPQLNNLVAGVKYYMWFMPQCRASGGAAWGWPSSGPPEIAWRYDFIAPSAAGYYDIYPHATGFYGDKGWWAAWFQGCPTDSVQGANLSSYWYNPVSLTRTYFCHDAVECRRYDGFPAGEPIMNEVVTW